jgi:hypothetical protein
MDIVINLKILSDHSLTPSWYAYLLCCYKEEPYLCASPDKQEEYAIALEKEGWCKRGPEKIIIRQKFLDLIKDLDTSPDNVNSWIEDWRELWPKGVKSAGRPVRGDKQGVIKKMMAFCAQYPEYTRSQIFEATKLYIFDKKLNNFTYMTCADYFIYKEVKRGDKTSLLASLLEDLDGKETHLEQLEKGGGSSWHKEV